MDENELNPTGLAGSADEDLQIIEDYLAGEQEDEEQDQGSVEQPIEQPIQQDQDPLTVDGQDLRDHPDYDELRLDIPWSEEEERGEYPLEIYDRRGFHPKLIDRIRTGNEDIGPDGRIDPINNPLAIR